MGEEKQGDVANRPSSNVASVRGSMRSMNLDDGYQSSAPNKGGKQNDPKGKGWCVRFGQSDHQWQSCPLPYKPQLAFGKSNGEPPSGKGQKKALLAEEVATPGLEDAGKTTHCDGKDNENYHNAGNPEEMPEEGYLIGPFFQSTRYSAGEHQDWYADENVWMCRSWN